jgi:hypothetical protein
LISNPTATSTDVERNLKIPDQSARRYLAELRPKKGTASTERGKNRPLKRGTLATKPGPDDDPSKVVEAMDQRDYEVRDVMENLERHQNEFMKQLDREQRQEFKGKSYEDQINTLWLWRYKGVILL